MKRVFSRIPIVILLLIMLIGVTLSSGCGQRVLTIVFTTPPRVLNVDTASDVMTIEIQDAEGMPISVEDDTVINLTTTSSTGKFFTSPTANWFVTSLTILKGSSSANFYYKDSTSGSHTITAAESPSQGWTTATQVQVVNATSLDHFTFAAISDQTKSNAFSVTITAQDSYGNTITSYTSVNSLSDTTHTINPTMTGSFVSGVWTGEVTITAEATGVIISTSGGDKAGTSNSFDVTVAAVSSSIKLVFTTDVQTISAGDVSGMIIIQARDASDNPFNVTEDAVINLTSSSANGIFYSDAAGTSQLSQVTIKTGESLVNFYYKDTQVGSPTITGAEAPSRDWEDATQQEVVNAAALDHFTFAQIGNQTANSSFSISITAQDSYGNTVTSYTGTNTLSDTTGTINPTTTGAFIDGIWTGNVTITSIGSQATLTTSGADKTGVSNAFNIAAGVPTAAGKLVFTTALQTVDASSVSGIITIQLQDSTGNPNNVTEDTIINLSSSSTGGNFYSDAGGLNQISQATISIGESSSSFYYRDPVAGSPTITGAETPSRDWTDATQVLIVNAGALDHFKFAQIGNQAASSSFSISITAQDSYGNTVTSYSGTNTLSDTTGTINPTTTGAFVDGVWTGEVTITSVTNGITISTSGADKTGVSDAFNVLVSATTAGDKLVFITVPQTIDAGNISGAITVQVQDGAGNPYNVTNDTIVNLTSSSSGGSFYSDAAGLSQITQVTIKAGENSAKFYYKDAVVGSPTITGAETLAQGWAAASQLQTIRQAATGTTGIGLPTYVIIIIGVGGLILGVGVSYFVFFRSRFASKGKKVETKPGPVLTEVEATNEASYAVKTESVEKQEKVEVVETDRKEPEPVVQPEKVEAVDTARKEPEPVIEPEKVEEVETGRKEPETVMKPEKVESPAAMRKEAVELLQEIETNRRIAVTSPTSENLTAFQTQVWDFKHDEVNALPPAIKEELTRAYADIYQANGIVWLANQLGRRSSNLDENYTRLCNGIAEQLDRIKKLME